MTTAAILFAVALLVVGIGIPIGSLRSELKGIRRELARIADRPGADVVHLADKKREG